METEAQTRSDGADFVSAKTVNEQLVNKREWLFVLARVYLGISFFFSDHGNARPNELAGFLKFAIKLRLHACIENRKANLLADGRI